jgi:hypothetical protein
MAGQSVTHIEHEGCDVRGRGDTRAKRTDNPHVLRLRIVGKRDANRQEVVDAGRQATGTAGSADRGGRVGKVQRQNIDTDADSV